VLFFALTKLAIEPEERHLREKFGRRSSVFARERRAGCDGAAE